MNYIIDCLAYVLGLLMDLFFRGLTFIGYPRLWACIVLYAVVTKFLFLPQRISNYKGKLLAPVVRRDLLDADPKFFEKTQDKELTIERAMLKKEINKKYKVSNGSGCLVSLIQFPFLAALFYVVKNPQEFVPSLEAMSNASSDVNSFLGVSLSAIPLNNIKFNGFESLVVCVPLFVMVSCFLKMFPSLKRAKTVSEKIKVYSLCAFFVLLLGFFSAKLPLAISLYWIAGDVTYMIFDFFIHRFLPKNKFISSVLEEYRAKVLMDAEKKKKEAEASVEGDAVKTDVTESTEEATLIRE